MESDRDKTLQVMARAMGAPVEGPEGEKWGEYPPFNRFARLALTALEASGRAVVPVDTDARREALKEAAKVATDAIDSMRARQARRPGVEISALLLVADRIYQGINRLSASPYGKAVVKEDAKWREITINQHIFWGWTPERDGKSERPEESAEARSAVANSKPVVKEDSE